MQTPNWSTKEFLSSGVMNAAAGLVSGSIAQLVSGGFFPGLIAPESVGLATSGLVATITAPLPFQIMFGSGVLASANGTTTGTRSSTYTANFSGVVPASGASVTAYLLASLTSIQEDPYQIPGPPAGHPDYDPTFVPFTAYATVLDTLSIAASLTGPDNVTTFELARATLASGAVALGTLSTTYQRRASAYSPSQVTAVSGAVTLSISGYGDRTLQFTSSGVATLPSVSGANGVIFRISSLVSGTTIVTSGGVDSIYGATVASAVTGITMFAGSSLDIEAQQGIWQVIAGSLNAASGAVLGSAASRNLGNTVIDPGTGALEVSTPPNAVSGTSYTYTSGDRGFSVYRQNAGTNMSDTIPGSGTLASGWFTTVFNEDPSGATLTLTASGNTSLDGSAGGSVTLLARQSSVIRTDGTAYYSSTSPSPSSSANIGGQLYIFTQFS